jgi:hypothetical protein
VYDVDHKIDVKDLGFYGITPNVDPAVGIGRFHSEIHSPRAVATMRKQVRPLPGSNGRPVAVVVTDLYIHGDGGYVIDVLANGGFPPGPKEFVKNGCHQVPFGHYDLCFGSKRCPRNCR